MTEQELEISAILGDYVPIQNWFGTPKAQKSIDDFVAKFSDVVNSKFNVTLQKDSQLTLQEVENTFMTGTCQEKVAMLCFVGVKANFIPGPMDLHYASLLKKISEDYGQISANATIEWTAQKKLFIASLIVEITTKSLIIIQGSLVVSRKFSGDSNNFLTH